jgi:hypothetical protein
MELTQFDMELIAVAVAYVLILSYIYSQDDF